MAPAVMGLSAAIMAAGGPAASLARDAIRPSASRS
jgi:hypothetical protein